MASGFHSINLQSSDFGFCCEMTDICHFLFIFTNNHKKTKKNN